MPAKKPAPRKTTARKPAKPAAKTTRKPTAAQTRRKKIAARPPRKKGFSHRITTWFAAKARAHAESHRHSVRARKDAAILRATHAGCQTCNGTGTIFTKDKHGAFSGSKPCPAKPAVEKVSKVHVHKAARFGADKRTGLIGWACPCGVKEKPRYHDAKTATAAVRTHERKKHGGRHVGAQLQIQMPEQKPATSPTPSREPVVKMTKPSSTGMTDQQWEKQNKPMHPATAAKKGVCWQCGGKGALYSAFGGEHITTACGECKGTGKAKATARAGAGK